MQFVIRAMNSPFPYPELGPYGRQLEGYIPPNVIWKQLNYGQGEGQIEIAGCEWGLYQTSCRRGLCVHLHVGEFSALAAFEFVQRIADMLCCAGQFEIVVQGTERPEFNLDAV